MDTRRGSAIMSQRKGTKRGVARMVDDRALHLVQSQLVTVIDDGDELLVGLLVAGRVRKVEAHERNEREHVGDRQIL